MTVLILILFIIFFILALIFAILYFSKREKKESKEVNTDTFYFKNVNYLQDFFCAIGHEGCYALSLVMVASEYLKQELDIAKSINIGIARGVIGYNEDNLRAKETMYVYDAERFLFLLTGVKWKVTKYGKGIDIPQGAYAIQEWQYNNLSHFEVVGAFPYIKDCFTTRNGELIGYRICEVLAWVVKNFLTTEKTLAFYNILL